MIYIGLFLKKDQNEIDNKNLIKAKKIKEKTKSKYLNSKQMKRRIKNSKLFSNVKTVSDDGLIELKNSGFASLIEIKAVDLSLSSNQEKTNFFHNLKFLYQIKNLNLKCYKLDEKINLNNNKLNLSKLIDKFKNHVSKLLLLEESKNLIEELEENNFTVSSIYYLVVIAKDLNILERQIDEIEDILSNLQPKINLEIINNRLEVYKFLSNLYLANNPLDLLMWANLPELIVPLNLKERTNMLKIEDKEVQLVTIKNIPPFVDELFFEEIFNYPNVRACLNIKDAIDQSELIRWVNSQYQFLLSDRNTTKKLSDATELDTQKENFQILMNDIKNGDEKIKEVSLILVVIGNKKEREEIISDLKRIVERYQIKLDIPRLRQLETFQSYDITTLSLKDYSIYLPTLTLSAGFPFTKTYFNDSSGYMLGVDIHTSLPIFFDPFIINNRRTSHNIAIISSTGGGKSFTMKKMIVNEFARGTKLFIFDAENEYEKLVKANNGEYIDLYSKKGGMINPLQIRYIPSDEEQESKETDCPLAKHLGFLEAFFKSAFDDIQEKEMVMLLAIVESLYNKKGIYKNTSINTLETLTSNDYPIFSDLYDYLPEYKKQITSLEKIKIIDQLEVLLSRFLTGTDSYLFNSYTSIDLNNDLIAFNLQELLYSGNQRIINTQILNLLTYLNNGIVANKIINEKRSSNDKKHVSIIVDEFHLYIDENNNEVIKNFGQLARRCRKYNTNIVLSSQCISDFLGNASVLRHASAIFNNCQYTMIGMLKEDDLKAYLELFKNNPLTDTQKAFLLGAKRGEFLLNVDNKTRLRIWIRATETERKMMGEES
ncbi:MAG: ATP-binding protein [Clostridia bacterium]|nr:ATP-binding protein [Clostridia bacterium]